MNNILDEIELRLRAASGSVSITVSDMIFTWLGDKGYTGTLGQRLGKWGEDNAIGISRVSLVATVPNPPTAVLAVPSNGSATVSFSPSYSGGSVVLDYTVTATPGNHTATGDSSSIVVPGLSNGVSYTFTVTARNSVGTSAASAPSSATTPATVPDAPAIFSAVAAPSSALITITAPASNGGSPITGYTVTSSPSGLTATGFSPLTVTGLTDGVSYTFTAVAHNSLGDSAVSVASPAVISASLPAIVTNVAGTQGDGSVALTWTAPNNGGSAITQYTINTVPPEFTQTSATNSHTFTGLVNGTAYQFEVYATNVIGDGPVSEVSPVVIPSGVPEAPSISSVVPGNTQVSVNWTAPEANGATIDSYTATSTPGSFTATGLTNPLVVTGLTNGTSYTFVLKATNENGDSANSAASPAVVPATVPGAPTIGTATASDAQASITFTAPASTGGSAITSYTATASPGGATGTSTSSPVIVTGLQNGIAHTFTVTATNVMGTSAASAASNSVTPTQSSTVPGAPTIGTATAGAGQATVAFTPPANIGGSAITSYTATSTPGGITASAASSPITVTGLTNGTAYTFDVYATNTSGNGPESSQSNAVTPVSVPGAPTIGTATAGDTQATVAFTAPADDGGSAISTYTATSSPGGITASRSASPITVTGLANGTAYTFTVTATNTTGTSAASAASNSITPATATTGPYDSLYAAGFLAVTGKALLTTPTETHPAPSTGLSNVSYTDQRFGTKIYRPFDAAAFGVSKLRHTYSRQQAFNCDGSTVLVLGGARYYLFNTTTYEQILGGRTNVTPTGAVGNNSISPSDPSDYSWHATDPNILYFKQQTGMIMYEYNVSAKTVTPAFDFTGRLGAWGMSSAANVTTGGEGRPSDDGRYWCFMVRNSSGGHIGYITYDQNTDTILGALVTTVSSNNVTMSSRGTYAILGRSSSSLTFTQAQNSTSLAGVRAYTRDFSSYNQLSNTAGHQDPCIDMDGDEAYVGVAGQYFEQLTWGAFWVRKCSGGLPTELYHRNDGTTSQLHVSGCGSASNPGWVIVSTYMEENATETGWNDHVVFALKLGLPFEARRIAHSRGGALNNSYWDEPHATVSRDGLRVVYATRFRETYPSGPLQTTAQEDYIVGLPSWFYGGSAPPAGGGGAENLVSNGTFDTATVWALDAGATITGGQCVFDHDPSNVNVIQTLSGLTAGTYRVSHEITSHVNGNVTMQIRTVGGTMVSGTTRQGPTGVYTEDLVIPGDVDYIRIRVTRQNLTVDCAVDNIVLTKIS